jgi:lipopolysaccharide export system permease protein
VKLITRYVCREFLGLFGLGLFAFLNIFLIVEFFERIDDFIEHHASFASGAAYFFYKIPMILFLVTPVAILLAAVLSLLVLGRNNEVTAMRACGVSFARIAAPILGLGAIASGFLFLANEFVIPFTNTRVQQIFQVEIKKRTPRWVVRRDNLWFQSKEGAIWNIRSLDPDQNIFKGVTLYRLTPQRTLLERIDAEAMRWDDKGWMFLNGRTRIFSDGTESKTEEFAEHLVMLPERPSDFKQAKKKPEEMNLVEIQNYIKGLRANGIDATQYTVDMHAKLSFPLVGFIMALVGVPFSLKTARSGGLARSLGLTILIGFSYFILFNTGLSLGHAGTLPASVAAWATNILFIATGLYMMASMKH